MSAALHLYEQLTEATDDKTRARLIAEAFDALETRFAQITDLSTQGQVRETELLLQKEVREVEGRLQQEIKRLDLKIGEVEGRLQKEIKQIELPISEVEGLLRTDIAHIKADLLKWLLPTMLAQVAAIAALVKLL